MNLVLPVLLLAWIAYALWRALVFARDLWEDALSAGLHPVKRAVRFGALAATCGVVAILVKLAMIVVELAARLF